MKDPIKSISLLGFAIYWITFIINLLMLNFSMIANIIQFSKVNQLWIIESSLEIKKKSEKVLYDFKSLICYDKFIQCSMNKNFETHFE